MTPDTQLFESPAPAARPRFVVPHDDVAEPPARVVEYVRPARRPMRVEPERLPSSYARPWPVSPHSRLPGWLARLLVVWGLITLVSLVGPCRPATPPSAFAAEASP